MGGGLTPAYTGVDSLILYTLSPSGVSEFMDLKLCKKKCIEESSLKNALKLGASAKILMATLLIYLSVMNFDEEDEAKCNRDAKIKLSINRN